MVWLLLLFLLVLSPLTYFILRHNVSGITRTPVWLLWLVMMTPAFILSGWELLSDTEIPLELALISFVVSIFLYFWLIQRGRGEQPPTETDLSASPTEKPSLQAFEAQKSAPKSPPPPLLDRDEETRLRGCFPLKVFYLQNVDYSPQAVLCRGKLRAVPEDAYRQVQENVEKAFGDRFLLVFQEGPSGEPFFALVPNPRAPGHPARSSEPLVRPGLASMLLGLTILTTTSIGASFAGVEAEQVQTDPTVLWQGLPYALALMAILGVHELSHYFAAVSYKIRTTLPYFIPVPFFLGTFGAFIQMKSPVPNRKALFDVSVAGPLGGFIVTLPLLMWGLSMSEVVPLSAEESNLLNVESLDPRPSAIVAVLSKLALGSDFAPGMAIDLHPIAIAGYIGLVVTALNLMPVGQLDGGHIVHAMYGQRTSAIIGQVARLLMLFRALIEPSFMLWALILFFMPIIDEPALNDVTELDNGRDFLGLLALALLVGILLPVPAAVTQWLNV